MDNNNPNAEQRLKGIAVVLAILVVATIVFMFVKGIDRSDVKTTQPTVQSVQKQLELPKPTPVADPSGNSADIAPAPEPTPPPAPEPPAMPSYNGVLDRINQTREALGLHYIYHSPAIDRAAAHKCQDMSSKNYWAHDAPDGRTFDQIMREAGYYSSQYGEILARQFYGNLDAQHQAWLNSPTHYGLIVADFATFGYATCNYPDGSDLTVVEFGQD